MMSVNVGMMRATPPMMVMIMTTMTKPTRALHQSRSFAVAAAAATAGGPSTSSSSTSNPAKPIPEWSNESNKETSRSDDERAAVRASSSSRSRRHRRPDWPLLVPADSFFFRDPFLLGDSLFSSPSATRHPLARHWLGPLQSLLGGIGVGIGGAAGGSSSPAVTAGAAGAAGAATNTNAIGALNNMLATAMAPLDDVSRGVWNWEAELLNPVRMELDEAEHKYVMRVRVPGMSKNDLHVKVEPTGYLHLWGEHVERASEKGKVQEQQQQQQQQAKQEEGAEKAERGDGVSSVSFERWIALPDSVHIGDIHAKFENGALLISLPKTEEAKQAQRSEIAID